VDLHLYHCLPFGGNVSHELNLKEIQKEWHGSYKAYGIGLLLSLVLTGISFFLVIEEVFSETLLPHFLMGLALVQAVVQLIFFLHLGQEAKPRWETLSFYFMLLILFIVVGGTLWIIYDLNVRVMSPMMR
jgi:cytochrome o ubiquinol oxidase subunit IV